MAFERNIVSGRPDDIPGFWKMLGPYFASRAVSTELGSVMSDTPQTRWFVCRDENICIGFAAVTLTGRVARWHTQYVCEAYRLQGVARMLDRARMVWTLGLVNCIEMTRTVRLSQKRRILSLEREGWKLAGKRGQYIRLSKKVIYEST